MPSPAIVAPQSTVALPALGPNARAASVQLVLDNTVTSVKVTLGQLPPNQRLGPIACVFVDNTQNGAACRITFPDTGCAADIPAKSAAWCLAVTGGTDFVISTITLGSVPIGVQAVNVLVPPTSIQPTVSMVNFGTAVPVKPLNLVVATNGVAVPGQAATDILPASNTRTYWAFQMPNGSDGWVNIGADAGVGLAGSFYLAAGEKYQTQMVAPGGRVSIYLAQAGAFTVATWAG